LIGVVVNLHEENKDISIDNDRLLMEVTSAKTLNSKNTGQIKALQTQIDSLQNTQRIRVIRETVIIRDSLQQIFPTDLSDIANNTRFIPDLLPLRDTYAVSQSFQPHHQAIDFATSLGRTVIAAAAGIIIACYEDRNLGNVIMIDHLNSYKTLYAHLDRFSVSINDFVDKGQMIGAVGNTGNSTNPHLHFQIYYENDAIDPNSLMKISTFKN
jgi:murein DD-endopeptidase MepM/ murein hydrolase activator NlpD